MALVGLRHHLEGIDGARLTSRFIRVLTAALVMAVAVALTEQWATAVAAGDSLVMRSGRLLAAIVVGLGTLAAAARVLRVPEFDEAVAGLWSRFVRPPAGRPGR
jgi:peptidoglycan biosynthesis protein MviN/MurJ (putative lipid II flippase)